MTQQFMAEMLGVRRASVVVVLGTLARAGMIENTYGVVTILDRAALEGAACECYRALREAPTVAAGRARPGGPSRQDARGNRSAGAAR